ncbi:MAG: PLP-dependent aminotransferase family protein, partial [Paraburkholderia sp.]|nr:PLP-dependent aminotransferase family protein [Paraburkholderia sp.]
RDVLLAHLRGPLAPWLEAVTPNTAGLHLAARLVAPLDAGTLVQAARGASVGLHPLAPFHLEAPVQSGFLFGYGGVDAERIDAALTSLAMLLRSL